MPKSPTSAGKTTSNSDDIKRKLTFGVEFEFLVLHQLTPQQRLKFRSGSPGFDERTASSADLPQLDPRANIIEETDEILSPNGVIGGNHSQLRRVQEQIAKALTKEGIPARTIHESKARGYEIPYWIVDTDPSIVRNRDDDYAYFSIEVQSPPYYVCERTLMLVRKACNILTIKFLTEVNKSTGLHVHCGKGNEGFPVDWLRRIVMFLWAFEPAITTLHPEHRRHSRWAASLREGIHGREMPSEGTVQQLQTLLAQPTSERLLNIITGLGPMAYNFQNLMVPNWLKQTIEFRQHAGTLIGKRTEMWIRLVVGIVEFCETVTDKEFNALIARYSRSTEDRAAETSQRRRGFRTPPQESEIGIFDLLDALRLHRCSRFYENFDHSYWDRLNGSDGEQQVDTSDLSSDSPSSDRSRKAAERVKADLELILSVPLPSPPRPKARWSLSDCSDDDVNMELDE